MNQSRRARLTMRALTASVRGLGPMRTPLARLAGAIWYARVGAADRDRAAANHRRLQPGLTRRAATRLARRSYQEYVRMMADSIWADPLKPAEIRRRTRLVGEEHLRQGREAGILAVAHFGNWDMAASAALAIGLRVTTVMAPIGAPWMTAMVEQSRTRKGLELFRPEQAARGLLRALRRGRMVALMVDVPEAGPTVTVQFCGGPVRFSAVPARLAAATNAPMIPAECWRERNGWLVVIHPPVPGHGDESAVMSRVAAVLEPAIRAHPEQWYPFHEVYADRAVGVP